MSTYLSNLVQVYYSDVMKTTAPLGTLGTQIGQNAFSQGKYSRGKYTTS
jgi:hypothetical protein